MKDVLRTLSQHAELTLGVCTSKRKDFAERILDLFELSNYFHFVDGGVDGGDIGIEKSSQLKGLLEEQQINHNSLMIGDREVDIIAAHNNQLEAAGVLWGHGPYSELHPHNPCHLFHTLEELLQLIETK